MPEESLVRLIAEGGASPALLAIMWALWRADKRHILMREQLRKLLRLQLRIARASNIETDNLDDDV